MSKPRRKEKTRRSERKQPAEPANARSTRSLSRTTTIVLLAAALVSAGLWWKNRPRKTTTPVWSHEIIDSYPHDPDAFTQGLAWYKGTLIEGTGKYGQSELRQVKLETGKILKRVPLPDTLFGEGVTLADNKIYQLTWKSGKALVYDIEDWDHPRQISYKGQGWGITYDGTHLITSDGSSTLRFRRVSDFKVVRKIKVRDGRFPLSKLNELEFANGYVLANIWYRDRIAAIDPATGQVRGWIDLRELWPSHDREAVLNGIAYDPQTKRLFVTGKNWPRLYEIRLSNW